MSPTSAVDEEGFEFDAKATLSAYPSIRRVAASLTVAASAFQSGAPGNTQEWLIYYAQFAPVAEWLSERNRPAFRQPANFVISDAERALEILKHLALRQTLRGSLVSKRSLRKDR